MATPDRESIDTFISITGSSELIAIHKLTEHGGRLNEAVNSYFTEGDANIRHETTVAVPHEDFMDIDDTHRVSDELHHPENASIDNGGNALPETVPETRGTNNDTRVSPSVPEISNLPDYGIEEEMIQAAIKASKREAQTSPPDVKHEKAFAELESEAGPSETRVSKLTEVEETETLASSNGWLGVRSSFIEDETEDADEQPLVRHRHRTRRTNSNAPSAPIQQQNANNPDEWGGISSEEHDEAVMLEAAMFGGVPEGAGYRVPNTRSRYTRNGSGRTRRPYTRSTPRPPSPTLTAQRLIREQQNDEYLASLQADREKELLEQAAREAAIEEEQRKLEQEQETERQLAAKEASLPQEPASDDNNAVTLLVRMPDGSRRGRRFMKTDKLQFLFDFIDIGRVVKPSTYRLVRPYPRRAFSEDESELTLNELGLSSKQEALFLEWI
ncbi:plant UBX domain-containing protein 8-like isoform X1 [Bidens hawaiensis]|uniref:plant UBX domain-containing protein 8-like isoform X1 n=1 Tax=Bidens hawaiensis TaxID=980011 RepID=UPI00404B29C8